MQPRLNLSSVAIVVAIGAAALAADYFISSFATAIVIMLAVATVLFARRRQGGRPLSLLWRVLLGGAVTVVVACCAVFLWARLTDQAANPAGGSSVPGNAFDALLYAYLVGLFFGLPAFCLWSIVCVVLAIKQRKH
jgi:hypothetical protein